MKDFSFHIGDMGPMFKKPAQEGYEANETCQNKVGQGKPLENTHYPQRAQLGLRIIDWYPQDK